jgi:hypothetical protein
MNRTKGAALQTTLELDVGARAFHSYIPFRLAMPTAITTLTMSMVAIPATRRPSKNPLVSSNTLTEHLLRFLPYTAMQILCNGGGGGAIRQSS